MVGWQATSASLACCENDVNRRVGWGGRQSCVLVDAPLVLAGDGSRLGDPRRRIKVGCRYLQPLARNAGWEAGSAEVWTLRVRVAPPNPTGTGRRGSI